jgi:NADPH:quinone reductase-like Zn-dependent oxidoreductase
VKASAIDDFATAPTVHELPDPVPGEGEVLVRVEASSVNGMDLAIASGMAKSMMKYELPIVLGRDYAGSVEAVGPGVTEFAVGDSVFGVLMKMALGPFGTFSELVATPAMFAAKIPEGLPVRSAGALGLAGATAIGAIDAIDPRPGQTVLISGATGGVGSFAVQLAKARGATVIATASPEDAAYVTNLGADEIVDYAESVQDAVRARHPEGIDAIVHAAGEGVKLASLLKAGGHIASTIGLTAAQVDGTAAKVTTIMGMPTTEVLDRLATAVVKGDLIVPIERSYDLQDAGRALQDFTDGKRGKLAITVQSAPPTTSGAERQS